MSRLTVKQATELAPDGWHVSRSAWGVEFRRREGSDVYVDVLVGRATPSYVKAIREYENEDGEVEEEVLLETRSVLAATEEKMRDALPEYVEVVEEAT